MAANCTLVKEDLLNPCSASSTLSEQVTVRSFSVQGISGAAADQVLQAQVADDGTRSIPVLNSSHPDNPNSYVTHVLAHPEGNGTFLVVVTYTYRSYPVPFLQSFHGGFRQVPTHYDVNGVKATVPYTPTGGSAVKPQVAALTRNKVTAALCFRFLQTTNPEAATAAYANNTNSAVWRGYAVGTVLCLPITGSTRDGIWFENTYQFEIDPDTFDEYAVYEGPDGRPPADIATPIVTDGSAYSGNGWARFVLNDQVDFNTVFPFIT